MSSTTIIEKRELILEGLDCASCAAKIEAKVKELDGIKDGSINFVTQVLTLEINKPDRTDYLISEVKAIVNELEPDVIIQEKTTKKLTKASKLFIEVNDKSHLPSLIEEAKKL